MLESCRCDGEGKVVNEVVVREIRGQPGDPAFLKIQLDCIREITRLKGLYPVGKEGKSQLQINIGTEIPRVDLSKVPKDNLLEVMRLLQAGQQEQTDVIDVESR